MAVLACYVAVGVLLGLPVTAALSLLLGLSLASGCAMVAIGCGMDATRSTYVRRLSPTPLVLLILPDLHRPLSSAREARGWLAHRLVPTVLFFRRFLPSRRDVAAPDLSLDYLTP